MKSIFDTKEFLALEPEQKNIVLQLELEKYKDDDLSLNLESLQKQEAELVNKLLINEDQISEFTKSGIDFSNSEKLKIVSMQLEELNKKTGQIKQKSIELEKNKKALELKNLIQKKNDLTHEIQELRKELESLHEQKIESQNSLVEIRANYDSFYSSYNEELSRLMFEEKNIYNQANSTLTEDAINDKFKLEEVLKSKNDEIIKLKEIISQLSEKCTAVESDILEKQEQINTLSMPEESKELIVQAKDLESEIIIYDDMMKRLDKLIDSNKEELELAKIKYSNELKSERKIEEDLYKINNSTAKVFENSELTNFEKFRNCDKSLENVKKVDYELKFADNRIQEIKNKIQSRLTKIEKLNQDILPIEESYNQKNEYLKQLKAELVKLEETREELLGNNCLGMITQYTNIGDLCTVCKTRVTQKNHIETIDLAGIEREIEMLKSKIGYTEKDINNVHANICGIKAIEEYEQNQIELDKKEISDIESSKTLIYKQVIDINDKTAVNFENLKGALTKTTNALENMINLENKLQDTVKDNLTSKVEYGTKISVYSELQEQLIDFYYVLQKERAERELLLLEAKASVSVDDFETKRVNFAQNELQVTELTKELINLYLQASELKNKIFVNQDSLCSLEYERGVIESKLSNSQNNIRDNIEYEEVQDITNISERIERLKESHRHLLGLKQDAENSVQNITRDYEIKTKILAFKTNEEQDVSALVSSLIYRYNFKDENEVKEYIVTDNMIKLKDSEIKSYNNLLEKLQLQNEYLSENLNDSDNKNNEMYYKLTLENQQLNLKLGEVRTQISILSEQLNEYNQLLKLIEKFKQ